MAEEQEVVGKEAQAAADAAAQTQAVIDANNAATEAALAAAAEKEKETQAFAEKVADAALQTEQGRQIADTQKGLEECRTQIGTLQAGMSQISAMFGELKTLMTQQATSPSPEKSSSIPQPSADQTARQVTQETTVTELAPSNANPEDLANQQPQAPERPRPKRRLI